MTKTDWQPSSGSIRIHERLVRPMPVFADDYAAKVAEGANRLRHASVAFVGLARNCAGPLRSNLYRLTSLVENVGEWRLHVETNDNEDETLEVLSDFCRQHKRATYTSYRLGRKQYSSEFAGPRTIALAEYRAACQQWVRDCAADCDYVVAIDWDAWGGWWHEGVMHGMGWLVELQGAYGMASVSLLESPQLTMDEDKKVRVENAWLHYDCWALRLNSAWDDYTAGEGAWKHGWIPPVGSPPIRVCSAFGGFAIYRTEAYLAGVYDGRHDCEHVPFHVSIANSTGQSLYLCPGMRTIMRWMEPTDGGGQHSSD